MWYNGCAKRPLDSRQWGVPMASISISQIQELVEQLPTAKLPHAYRLLRELAEDTRPAPISLLQVPLSERRRILAEQALQMVSHYEQTADERQAWQGGDFRDEY